MAYLPNKDLYLEIAKGNELNHSDYSAFGINEAVSTSSVPEDIWSNGGIFTPPTTYRVHNISSTSANDTAAGTGARTVRVFGVVSTGLAEETITLNGITDVLTINSYSDIYRMVIYTSGSGLTNAGLITAKAVTDGTTTAAIQVNGFNASRKCIRLIPPGYKGYLNFWQATMTQSTASNSATIYLLTKTSTGVWITRSLHSLSNSGNSSEKDVFQIPLLLSAGEWIKPQCTYVSANNTLIQCDLSITLVKD